MTEDKVEISEFRIRIVKCSYPMFWYNDKIGEEFSVINVSARDYYVSDKNGGILIIDAEIVE